MGDLSDFNDKLRVNGREQTLFDLQNPQEPPNPVEKWLQSESDDVSEILDELAKLSLLEYDKVRKKVVKNCGIRVQTLDEQVNKRRHTKNDAEQDSFIFPDSEPWPEPVDGDILDEIVKTFKEYLVLEDLIAETATLWAALTHCFNEFQTLPLLLIRSPEKRCGKTLFLTLLSYFVYRPLSVSNITPAAIFRTVEKYEPTLLIDEADTFLNNNSQYTGIINSGHTKRTAFVIRTVGDDHEPKQFLTFCPKAIAMIQKYIPDTIVDRSIPIKMKRKTPGETRKRFRTDANQILNELQRKLKRFIRDNIYKIGKIDPDMPRDLNDRAADNWRPLFIIAKIAGNNWPRIVLKAALTLNGIDDSKTESTRTSLLRDIRYIFEMRNNPDTIATKTLLHDLNQMSEKPWPEFNRGNEMSARQLANLLRPFEINSKTIRFESEVAKGYERESFKDTFTRYLRNRDTLTVTNGTSNDFNNLQRLQSVTDSRRVSDDNIHKSNNNNTVTDVTYIEDKTVSKEISGCIVEIEL